MAQHLPSSLRKALESALITDSDLDAFCIDHFPRVHKRFTTGMDRTAKLNALIEQAGAAEIYPLLSISAKGPETCRPADGRPPEGLQIPAYRDDRSKAFGEHLHQLYERKEQLIVASQDADAIDQEILALRREQRLGVQIMEGEFLGQGRYRLLNRLGQGGFATVFRAYDRRDAMLVAIKILHSQWAQDRSRLERFIRGARKMRRLQHPAIVRVLSEYIEDSAFHYFVMDYLTGGDLRSAMKLGKLDVQRALEIILQVGDGLSYAHSCGLVHRDVKPGNILLRAPGEACLTDFDLVWAADSTGGTETGALGTFVYAAPEVMKDARTAGPPADVYSLGMTAIAAVSGEDLPVEAFRDTGAFIERLNLAPAVKYVLGRAVEWQVERRYPTMGAFTDGLRNALAGGSGLVEGALGENPKSGLSAAAGRSIVLRRTVTGGAAAVLLVIAVCFGYARLGTRAVQPFLQSSSDKEESAHLLASTLPRFPGSVWRIPRVGEPSGSAHTLLMPPDSDTKEADPGQTLHRRSKPVSRTKKLNSDLGPSAPPAHELDNADIRITDEH